MIVEDCNSNTIENVMRIMAAADDDDGSIEIMMSRIIRRARFMM